MGYFYHETFTGSGDLSTHPPDVGGAYVDEGTDPYTNAVLDGGGGLPFPTTTVNILGAQSAFVGSVAGEWVLTLKLAMQGTAAGPGMLVRGVKTSDSTRCAAIDVRTSLTTSGNWRYRFRIYDADGVSNLFSFGYFDFTPTGLVQEFKLVVRPGVGVEGFIDGVSVFTDTSEPGNVPDTFYFEMQDNTELGPDTAVIDEMSVDDGNLVAPPDPSLKMSSPNVLRPAIFTPG